MLSSQFGEGATRESEAGRRFVDGLEDGLEDASELALGNAVVTILRDVDNESGDGC